MNVDTIVYAAQSLSADFVHALRTDTLGTLIYLFILYALFIAATGRRSSNR